MSRGYCGSARILEENEHRIIYEYWASNLNESAYYNVKQIYDGMIILRKDALVEPQVRIKRSRLAKGRKKTIVKRIRNDVNYLELIADNKIIVENSSFCWQFTEYNVGMVAMHLITKIFNAYQDDGTLPKEVSYYV